MHASTLVTFLTPFLAATLSSARPLAPAAALAAEDLSYAAFLRQSEPMDMDAYFASAGLPVEASPNRASLVAQIVANVTARAPRTPRASPTLVARAVYNPKASKGPRTPGAFKSTTTRAAVAAPAAPSSTAKTCALTADCAGQTVPANANVWCNQATKTCAWKCNSKSTLTNGQCVRVTAVPAPAPATTTQAPAPAPTTTAAPASTSAAAPIRQTFTGQATYFFQNGNPGACGVWNSDNTRLVALDYRLYGNMGVQSSDCGRSLTITNTANGKSVVAIAQDACPSCASKYSLDLSTGAFDAIGDRDTGILPISWYWNN